LAGVVGDWVYAEPLHSCDLGLCPKQKDMDNMVGFNELGVDRKYAELVGVLEVMERYNRADGWMRWDGDKVRFYDGEVDGGTYIQVAWIRLWVKAFR